MNIRRLSEALGDQFPADEPLPDEDEFQEPEAILDAEVYAPQGVDANSIAILAREWISTFLPVYNVAIVSFQDARAAVEFRKWKMRYEKKQAAKLPDNHELVPGEYLATEIELNVGGALAPDGLPVDIDSWWHNMYQDGFYTIHDNPPVYLTPL